MTSQLTRVLKKSAVFIVAPLLIDGNSCALLAQQAGKDSDCSVPRLQPVRALTSDARYRDYWPTVSPDGQQVVFARRELQGDSRWRLWIIPFAGGEPKPLTPDDPASDASFPSWSPDGRMIAFRRSAARADGPGGIWLMTPAGGLLRPLTDGKGFDEYTSAWSRDGKWLTLIRASIEDWNYDVWQVSLDGKERRLTTHKAWDGRSTISPDGKQIAFASVRDGTLNIWAVLTDQGETSAKQLTFKQGRTPAWSPNGEWIAFSSNREGSYDLYLKPVAGGCAIRVTDGPTHEFHPVWSPDGNWLVVDTDPDKEQSHILVVDVRPIVADARRNRR